MTLSSMTLSSPPLPSCRYSGRTLDTYRHDLRSGFFQWAADTNLVVLAATRPHIELYRSWMEQRALVAAAIDRRLSTVCGFYRFADIDGRVGSEPGAVRAPTAGPSVDVRCLDRSELGVSDGTHDRSGYRREVRGADSAAPRRAVARPAHRAPVGPFDRQARRPGRCAPRMLRAAFIMTALDAGVPLREVQVAARHADPRTTTIYERRRQNFGRHAAYVVVAFVVGR
jgi:site-specific recombinase XerD